MTRRSITHTTPNDDWLKAQVGKGKEYGAKSDLVNDLISKARADQEKIEVVRGMKPSKAVLSRTLTLKGYARALKTRYSVATTHKLSKNAARTDQ